MLARPGQPEPTLSRRRFPNGESRLSGLSRHYEAARCWVGLIQQETFFTGWRHQPLRDFVGCGVLLRQADFMATFEEVCIVAGCIHPTPMLISHDGH
jgi:hypothetical protein